MVKYNLEHLNQPDSQIVGGPIQDDEALFLYSIIRGCRLERILEIGGLNGYSGNNFLQALKFSKNGILYTCDTNPVPIIAENHRVIRKNGLDLTLEDVDNQTLDLIFFDCHDMIQMEIYRKFSTNNLINDGTIIALHDTNLHYPPWQGMTGFDPGMFVPSEKGYAHQPVERKMVNMFKYLGYDVFSISTNSTKHDSDFPFRHGITVCKKFSFLA